MMATTVPNTAKVVRGFLLILPEEGQNPSLQNIKSKIRKTYPDVNVSEYTPTEEDNSNSKHPKYNEFMIKADVNFGSIQDNQIRKKNLLQRFCQENVMSGIGESWLNLNVFSMTEMINRSKPLLNSFALGTVVYMNTFVEHFSSAWSANDEKGRITVPTVHFKHDIRKLQINFNVADKTTKNKDLKSAKLHMLDLDYNMILRILIEVQKQENVRREDDIVYLRLYLFMSGPPLIRVREVKEENDLEDDEQAFREENDIGRSEEPNKRMKFHEQKTGNYSYIPPTSSNGKRNYHQRDTGRQAQKETNNSKSSQEIRNTKYISPALVDDKMFYCRAAEFGIPNTNSYCSSKVFGMSKVLRLDLQGPKSNSDTVWQTVTQLICCCPEAQVFFTSMNQREQKKEYRSPTVSNDYFNCLYALKTVLSPSFFVADEIGLKYSVKEVECSLKEYATDCSEALEQSLFEIQAKHEKGEIIRFMKALESLFKQNKKNCETTESRKSLPDNMVMLRRTLLTPTRCVFLPPIAHMESYMLRNTNPEFALRVTIRDDNCDQMTFTISGTPKGRTEFLKKAIGEKLLRGIKIGKREYCFFGSSTSQLREHGCLFYAEDEDGSTAKSIRKEIGELHSIKNVAKYMARMGQSLSQALYNVTLPQEFMDGPVKDITVSHDIDENFLYSGKEYTFSDGIGQMSMEVAEMCYKKMKLNEDDYRPCALQIRYAGYKGVVLLNPELEGKKLVLRKSMWKFDSPNDSLEILKGSYPQVAYLNRPFITILEQMGVDKKVFLELQSGQLRNIFNSLYSSTDAVKLLHEESILRLPFEALEQCGVDLAFDPFFRPMIMALCTTCIGVLKHKARIKLPLSEARTMLGVMDETGTLEYGQVFVQYTDDFIDGKPSKEATVLKGEIMITKNPCMHPGDVRKFTAVDVPALGYIKDCLVFPQKGPRPHPDEMAGSDLDGDEYCVIWHKPLIFECENHEAMDYSNDNEALEKEHIDVKEMVEFMCDYIRDDCVGLIASAHLAWADTLNIFHPMCMSLAKKYSVTLDFAKSGKPERLGPGERVKKYPDFMEKFREKDCYLSTKTLGFLFRNCKKIEIVANILSTEVPVEIDPIFICEGWEKYQPDAESSLLEYIHLFSTPTRLFRLTNEGEIMSGAIKKLEKTFQGKNIEKNVAKMLETVIPHVMKKMKTKFYHPFLKDKFAQEITRGCQNQEEALLVLQNYMFQKFKFASMDQEVEETPLMSEMLQKASAWYKVAYESKQDGSSLYLGLPWVVPEFLGILCAKNKGKVKPTLELKIRSFLNSSEANLEAFLKGKPSEDSVELSKQIMKALATHLGGFVNLYGAELKELHRLMDVEMKEESKSIDASNVTTERMIFLYLNRLAKLYTACLGIKDQALKKELGIIAIISLSMISSTGKLWEKDPNSIDDNPRFLSHTYLTKEYREEIRFPLNMGRKQEGKGSFKETMLQHTTEIAELMKRYSRVSITPVIDFKEDKGWKEIWYVLVSIYGKPFNIEALKDAIVQPDFDVKVQKAVNEDCCIM